MTDRRSRSGWLAAEFVVVVLGVVVGLAVDQWREGRAERDLEVRYLERLQENLEADTLRFAEGARLMGLRADTVQWLLGLVADAAPSRVDPVDVLGALAATLWSDFPRARDDTYRELISQGDLGRVESLDLRDRLAEYYDEFALRRESVYPEWEDTARRVELAMVEWMDPEAYRLLQRAVAIDDRPLDAARLDRPLPDGWAGDALMSLRDAPALRNLLFRQSMIQARLVVSADQSRERARQLLGTLDDELLRLRGR